MSLLRQLDPDGDAEALHAVYGDEASARYLLAPANKTVAETRDMLIRWTTGWEANSWAITDGKGERALRRVATFGSNDGVWEIGIMMCPAARGLGLAMRGCAEAIEITFERDNARRIVADIDPDNGPSVALFERLGFQKEGHLRGQYMTHLGARDALIYGLMAEDRRVWKTGT